MNGGIGCNLLNRLSLLDTVMDENRSRYRKVPPLLPERGLASSSSNLLGSAAGSARESLEDYDFSDVVLKYISQMLMEEDVEEKTCMFH
ncbi:hypothetical protein CDL15_Pgr025894 [Punica granatum]|nr:hypothetical protein CDL15_Pgr025894 [Punica granatum]